MVSLVSQRVLTSSATPKKVIDLQARVAQNTKITKQHESSQKSLWQRTQEIDVTPQKPARSTSAASRDRIYRSQITTLQGPECALSPAKILESQSMAEKEAVSNRRSKQVVNEKIFSSHISLCDNSASKHDHVLQRQQAHTYRESFIAKQKNLQSKVVINPQQQQGQKTNQKVIRIDIREEGCDKIRTHNQIAAQARNRIYASSFKLE